MRQNNVINIDLEKSGRVMCYLLIYVAHSTEYKGAVHNFLKSYWLLDFSHQSIQWKEQFKQKY